MKSGLGPETPPPPIVDLIHQNVCCCFFVFFPPYLVFVEFIYLKHNEQCNCQCRVVMHTVKEMSK